MHTVEFASSLPFSASAVFDWHARPGAFQRLVPPWAPVRLEQSQGIREGDRAVLRIGPGPLALRWVAEHHDVIADRQFCDRQVQGPFAHWDHTHRFEPVEEGGSRLVDHVEYILPAGALGKTLVPGVDRELRRQLAYRHRITRRDLSMHRHYNPDGRTLTVAVSGASGLIGSQLVPFLTTGGHSVRRLVRSRPTGDDEIHWDPEQGTIDAEQLEGVDAVIHLAGEPVFGLWTADKKRQIYESRVDGTSLLAEALAGLDDPPDIFVSASGVNYYGDHGADAVGEDSASRGQGFLTEVCRAWEGATAPASEAGIRTVHARIGAVLTPAGGALRLMLPAFWLGLGARIGASDRYLSWIALDDVLGGLYHALWTEDLEGAVNLTAPTPVPTNRYARILADVLNRPVLLHLPDAVVRSVGGEMAEEMVLTSLRVLPRRLTESGYAFGYEGLDGALRHLLGRTPTDE